VRSKSAELSNLKLLFTISAVAFVFAGCSNGDSSGASQPQTKPIAEYCTNIQSPANPITVSGKAFYQFRENGNGAVSEGLHTLSAPSGTLNDVYTVTIDGVSSSYTCPSVSCSGLLAASELVNLINASSTTVTAAASIANIKLTPKNSGDPIVIGTLAKVTETIAAVSDPRPIRYAEVRAISPAGALAQCAQTDATGAYSLTLPGDGQTYTVEIAARASNAHNTAYVMNNPTDNEYYKLNYTVVASGASAGTRLLAKATGDLLGGAFNILDQILNAQEYLRAKTAGCNTAFADCTPFTAAPTVFVYWTKGLSPGVYAGISGGISYYLNGQRQLYILGGVNGDVDTSDMDHYDNSVIVHEYGHFIEDQFGSPNSPGGSHNGDSIIDPRLAWGEGWADFFQGAVLTFTYPGSEPLYRDTYGHDGCTQSGTRPCTGLNFNETLDPSVPTYKDKPTATGEGNFREFSVARALYAAIKLAATNFKQIWTSINGSTSGMKVVADPFKSISRFHQIQVNIPGNTDWSTFRTNEKQLYTRTDFATPLTIANGCSGSPVTMNVYKSASDEGSFATSNLLVNNDFYVYSHPGGVLTIVLSWSSVNGTTPVDLDLYLYKSGYIYGNSASVIALDQTESSTPTGTATISANVGAGTYMINIMAFTGLYTGTATVPTTYSMKINNQTACPNPTAQ
jgi:hypothetical protein